MAAVSRKNSVLSDPQAPLRDIRDHVARLHLEVVEAVLPARIEPILRQWFSRLSRDLDEDDNVWLAASATTLAVELETYTPSHTGQTLIDRLPRRRKLAPDEEAAFKALKSARFVVYAARDPIGEDVFTAEDLATKQTFVLFDDGMPPEAVGMPLAARLCPLDNETLGAVGVVTPLDEAGLAVALGFVRPGRGIPHGHRCAAALYKHIVRNGGPRIAGLNDFPDDDDLDDEEVDQGPTPLDLVLVPLIDFETHAFKPLPPETLDEICRMVSAETVFEALYKAVIIAEKGAADVSALYRRSAEAMIEALHLRALAGSGIDRTPLDTLGATIDREVVANPSLRPAADLFREIRRAVTAVKPRRDEEDGLVRVIERIRGLRAKTVDQGCTEDEALAAATKVAELLDRYGLSLDEVELRRQACLGLGIDSKRKRMQALDDCLPAVAHFCDCRCWHERMPDGTIRSMLFGLPADVEAARYLYERVTAAFATETATFQKGAVYRNEAGEGRKRSTTSFQLGLAQGIRRKLLDRKTERNEKTFEATGRDLVPVKDSIVEDELAKLGLNFVAKNAQRGRMVALDAYEAGQTAAGRFEIQSELEAEEGEA